MPFGSGTYPAGDPRNNQPAQGGFSLQAAQQQLGGQQQALAPAAAMAPGPQMQGNPDPRMSAPMGGLQQPSVMRPPMAQPQMGPGSSPLTQMLRAPAGAPGGFPKPGQPPVAGRPLGLPGGMGNPKLGGGKSAPGGAPAFQNPSMGRAGGKGARGVPTQFRSLR